MADVAGYLGMTTHSLYAWIKKFGPDFAKHNAMSDEQAEIRRSICVQMKSWSNVVAVTEKIIELYIYSDGEYEHLLLWE